MKLIKSLLIFFAICSLLHCNNEKRTTNMNGLKLKVTKFGDSEADLYCMTNSEGMEVCVTNYGGIITSVKTPDRLGQFADIVLGFDNLEDYQNQEYFFGAIIGRYGNRIANGKFSIDGKDFEVTKNNGPNLLHGGTNGFHKQFWDAKPIEKQDAVGVSLSRTSPDGEEGFPGNLQVNVQYTLNNKNELTIEYFAETDKPTVCNLTNHSYFNLKGEGSGTIEDHFLVMVAEQYLAVDSNMIPNSVESVKGTPFDFIKPAQIGIRINENHAQLKLGGGYDHTFILKKTGGGAMSYGAVVQELGTGRALEVRTTEPGCQLYTANFLDGGLIGKSGQPYGKRSGFCLETQHYPNSPNQPEFPTTVLRPGEMYQSQTVYRFYVREE